MSESGLPTSSPNPVWMLGKECKYCGEVIQIEWEDGEWEGTFFAVVNDLLIAHWNEECKVA